MTRRSRMHMEEQDDKEQDEEDEESMEDAAAIICDWCRKLAHANFRFSRSL